MHSLELQRYVEESRWERIDGQLIPRPTPGDVHAEIQDKVKDLLKAALSESSYKVLSEWSITRPDDVNLHQPDYMTPDVLVAYVPYERTESGT